MFPEIDHEACLLIACVRAAIKNGVKHFDADGNPLTTERAILEVMARSGKGTITCDDRGRVPVTTAAHEFRIIEREVAMMIADQYLQNIQQDK